MEHLSFQPTKEASASFFVDNPDIWESEWGIARHFLPHARVRTFSNAIVLPLRLSGEQGVAHSLFQGGLCDKSGRFLAGRRRAFWDPSANLSCLESYPVPESSIEHCDEDVVFGGIVYNHYGHLLTDTTARLWYVISHPEDHRRIVFLKAPAKFDWAPADCLELFNLAGVRKERIVFVDRPTRFRSVLVPEEAVYSLDAVRPEWMSFFDAVRANVEPSSCEKVYLSRTHFKRGDSFNEDLFENYWASCGYRIVHPEECSLREEIAFVSGAKELVATIGTLSHNFVFAKPGAHAVVLLRSELPVRLQLLIGAARGLRSDYVQASRNILPTRHNDGVFYLFPTRRFLEYVNQSGLQPFGRQGIDLAFSQNRVASYAAKWMEVFDQRISVPETLKSVLDLDVIGGIDSNPREIQNLVVERVLSELVRFHQSENQERLTPAHCSISLKRRMWILARYAKYMLLRKKHDL